MGRVAVGEVAGGPLLELVGQVVVLAARKVVHLAAHSPEKVARPENDGVLTVGDNALRDELLDRRYSEMHEGDPERRMEVAQPARAFLDVRLPEVDRAPVFEPRSAALGDLPGDIIRRPPVEHIASHDFEKGRVQVGSAGDQARFEERGADLDVLPGEVHALLHGPHAVPDVEARVPEEIEELRRPLPVGLVAAEEHDVDVGMGVQLSPAVPADRDESGHGARGRKRSIGFPERPVDEPRAPLHHLAAGSAVKMSSADNGVFFVKKRLQAAVMGRSRLFVQGVHSKKTGRNEKPRRHKEDKNGARAAFPRSHDRHAFSPEYPAIQPEACIRKLRLAILHSLFSRLCCFTISRL